MGDKKPGKGKKPKSNKGKGNKGGPPNQTDIKTGGHQQHSGSGR